MTVGNVPKLLLTFSLPMLIGALIQTMYSWVNGFWVGRYLGKEAMSAVTVSFPIIFVVIAIALGLTMAASILVSQHAGAKRWTDVQQTVQTSTTLVLIISVLLAILGIGLTEFMLRAIGTPEAVYPMAVPYTRIVFLALPAQFIFFLVSSLLRGVGDSMTPLYYQSVALILTAIIDPFVMFGWAGLPKLGLNGTAIAMLVMMSGANVALYWRLHQKRHIVSPTWRRLSIHWSTCRLMIKIGLPSAIQQAIVSLGMVFIVGFINHFGEEASAAFGAAMRIDQVAFFPAMTLSMAISALAGQNIGAQRYHRVHAVFWWGLALSAGITLLISLAALLVPGSLIRLFIDGARDPEVVRIGIGYLRIVGMGYLLLAVMFTSNGIINGAGHTFYTTLVSLVGVWAVRIPIAAFFALAQVRDGAAHLSLFGMDLAIPVPGWLTPYLAHIEGIWYAMVAGFLIGAGMSVAYYISGRWKRTIIKHPVPEPDAPQPA